MLKFLGSLHSAGFAFTVNREAQPITRTESEAGCKYWHLVKQDDLNTGIKISSEVFLTRLLATKVCQSLTCTVCVSEIKMWNLKEETFLDNIFSNLKSLFIIYAEVIICSHLYTCPKGMWFVFLFVTEMTIGSMFFEFDKLRKRYYISNHIVTNLAFFFREHWRSMLMTFSQ